MPINHCRLSKTLIATVSNVLPVPFFRLARSTNAEEVLQYFVELHKALPLLDQKVWLVLDNAQAHHGIAVKPFLKEHFNVLYTPSGSPQLNSCEHIWSPIKHAFAKKLVEKPRMEWDQEHFDAALLAIATGLDPQVGQNCVRSNHGYLRRCINPQVAAPMNKGGEQEEEEID